MVKKFVYFVCSLLYMKERKMKENECSSLRQFLFGLSIFFRFIQVLFDEKFMSFFVVWRVSFDIFREFFFSFIRVVRLCKALVDAWLMWDFIRGKSVRRESWVQLKITNWPAFRIFKIYRSWTHFLTLKLHKKSLKIGLSDIVALLSRNEIFPRSSLKFFASRLRRNCPKKLSRAWDWAQMNIFTVLNSKNPSKDRFLATILNF